MRSVEIEAAEPEEYTDGLNARTPPVTCSPVYPVVSPHAKYRPYSSGDVAPTLHVAHLSPEGSPKSTYSYPL